MTDKDVARAHTFCFLFLVFPDTNQDSGSLIGSLDASTCTFYLILRMGAFYRQRQRQGQGQGQGQRQRQRQRQR